LGMAAVAAMVEPASLVPSVAWLVGSLIGALVPAWLPAALITCSIVHFVGPLLVNLRVKKLEPGLKSSRFR